MFFSDFSYIKSFSQYGFMITFYLNYIFSSYIEVFESFSDADMSIS